ncbi:MAG: hypothetical protein GC205_07650 [Bacteroidetes bacterium]|nr:hypothetical protein [Bacteroidota bacterium]
MFNKSIIYFEKTSVASLGFCPWVTSITYLYRFLAFVSLVALWSLPAEAISVPKTEANDSEDSGIHAPLAPSLLWSITGNGLADSSWLYGTIHLIGQDDFFVRPAVERSFGQSKQVAFEIKLDDMAMLLSMSQMLLLPENQTLSSLLEPELYEKLRSWLEDSLGLSMGTYERQKPFALLQAVTMLLLPENPASYELYFLMEAKAQNKPIYGLETIADQLGIFDSIPASEQALWTLETLQNRDSMTLLYQELVHAYKNEDLETLDKLMKEESPEFEAYAAVLLDDRNKRWIPDIENLVKEQSSFIAVGAGHLAGPLGVIALLRQKGYQVEPVLH